MSGWETADSCGRLEAAASRHAPAERVAAAKGSQERRLEKFECTGDLIGGPLFGIREVQLRMIKTHFGSVIRSEFFKFGVGRDL